MTAIFNFYFKKGISAFFGYFDHLCMNLTTVLLTGGDSTQCISCYWSIYNPSYAANCFDYIDPNDSYTPIIDCADDSCETELDIDDGTCELFSTLSTSCTEKL